MKVFNNPKDIFNYIQDKENITINITSTTLLPYELILILKAKNIECEVVKNG